LVDSSKFGSSSGNIVCALEEIDMIITDTGISHAMQKVIGNAGVKLIIADAME
jgi:DeoR family transcriptional regulator, ulaG and ulaABCDEF operon transcriptional repressor